MLPLNLPQLQKNTDLQNSKLSFRGKSKKNKSYQNWELEEPEVSHIQLLAFSSSAYETCGLKLISVLKEVKDNGKQRFF